MSDRELELGHPLVQDLLLNPSRWRMWPAVAVLRWMLRKMHEDGRRLIYRSNPSLAFTPSEISDVAVGARRTELFQTAIGLTGPGSPLPVCDVERVVSNSRRNGALAMWLDGPTDRFLHALETAQAFHNAAFSVATGGQVRAFRLMCQLAGYATPIAAEPGGRLLPVRPGTAPTAGGLAAPFLTPPTASGLRELFQAFTELPIRVIEFAGARLRVLQPARIGGPIESILGTTCHCADAAVEVEIEGGSDPDAHKWAQDPARREALHLLAKTYIGMSPPIARLFLRLDPDNAVPAGLDGHAALGGLALLGRASLPVRFPLAD